MRKKLREITFPNIGIKIVLILFLFSTFLFSCKKEERFNFSAKPYALSEEFALYGEEASAKVCLEGYRGFLANIYKSDEKIDFFSDTRSYFLSKQFRIDYSENKWKGGISFAGITLGAGAKEKDLDIFQEEIQKNSSQIIGLSTYKTMMSSNVSIDAMQKFNECIKIVKGEQYGFSVDLKNPEAEDLELKIHYRRIGETDKYPRIVSAELRGFDEKEAQKILKDKLKKGTKLNHNIPIIALRNTKKDMLIVIMASNGTSLIYRLPAFEQEDNSGVPVGTIVTSLLSFDKFSKITNNNINSPNGFWSKDKSKWAPADGRLVSNSKYSKEMNEDKVPAGMYCISTSNRNFEGRQGRGGRTHLVSPAMAVAAAIRGKLSDVREI
jgi:hypothetical protein